MDLSLSDEQKQLQDAAERFVRDKYTFENRRKIAATERGWLPENWAQFAELGWLGMAFSASQPFSVATILRRFSKVYLSRTKRSAASFRRKGRG